MSPNAFTLLHLLRILVSIFFVEYIAIFATQTQAART